MIPPPPRLASGRLRRRGMQFRWAAGLTLLALVPLGCAYRPGHPVLRGPWGAGSPAPVPAAGGAGGAGAMPDPTPSNGTPAEARRAFFSDWPQAEQRLAEVRPHATALRTLPWVGSLPHVERAVLARMRGRGPLGGVLKNLAVLGQSGHVPLPPAAVADLWLDPALEGRSLGADAFRIVETEYVLPEARRIGCRVDFRGVGQEPFTFDLRFSMWAQRLDLADGTVLLRYDPRPLADTLHVSLWRGVCLIEPDGAATRVTEVMFFGTDISMPFFLEGLLRDQVEKTLSTRVQRLYREAYARAERKR